MRSRSRPGPGDPTPLKRFGQHFLVDDSVVQRIVEALAPAPGDRLLEIGPGRGALTEALLQRGAPLAAIELDRRMLAGLESRFGAHGLHLIHGDVLEVPLDAVLRDLRGAPGDRLLVTGNLPYNVSKPVVQKLIRERAEVLRAVLMFQREVVDRLVAGPGSRSYGPLGILAREVFEIRRLFDVPPGAFRPVPAVVSSVTRWRPRERAAPDGERLQVLRAVLGAAFARRRRTLANNLRAALDDERAGRVLRRSGVDGSLRAETLPVEAFHRLAAAWPAPEGSSD